MLCEANLTEKEIFDSMITMPKNKSPAKDSLKIEFCPYFWHGAKDFYINSKSCSQMKKIVQCLCKV